MKHLAGDPALQILGLDLGQSKSAWKLLDRETGEVTRGQVGMTDSALQKLLGRTRPDQVVLESGPLAARVHDRARVAGIAVLVGDTTQDAW